MPSAVNAKTGLPFHAFFRCVKMCISVEFHQQKKGLSALTWRSIKFNGSRRDLLIHRLHAFLGQVASVFDLLRAVRIREAVQHAARPELLGELWEFLGSG